MTILAHHIVLSAYGFWLPNDPRGSGSNYVGGSTLYQFGAATHVDTTHSIAAQTHDQHARLTAKQHLNYPAVRFTGRQALCIAKAFGGYAAQAGIAIYALAVLPEHCHLVVTVGERNIDRVVVQLKGDATQRLKAEELYPFQGMLTSQRRTPACWARRYWKVFLQDHAHVRAAIRYVEQNPLKEGKPRQHWSFVKHYLY